MLSPARCVGRIIKNKRHTLYSPLPNAGLSKARDTMRDPKCALSLDLSVAKFASTSILSCMSKQGQTLGQTRRTACKIIPLLIMRTMRCRGSIIYNKHAVSRASRRSYHQRQKTSPVTPPCWFCSRLTCKT